MNFYTLHLKELEMIKQVQSIRGDFLDHFMLLLNLLDTFPFYILVISLIWFSYNQKFGIRLLFLFFITAFVNQYCKEFFAEPRPCKMDPSLCMLQANSYGFPSGAAQSMVVLFGYLAFHIKKKPFWLFSIFMVLLISFSRIYLGLHFFTDIFGGWLFGLLILSTYIFFLPKIEKFLSKKSKLFLSLLSIGITVVFALLAMNKNGSLIVFSSFGVMIGLIYSTSLKDPKLLILRILRPLIVLAGTSALLLITLLLPEKNPYLFEGLSKTSQFLAGFWMSYGVNPIIRWIEKSWIKT